MGPHSYTQLTFEEEAKITAFETNVAGKTGYLHTEN
jgi:hypothetical protein